MPVNDHLHLLNIASNAAKSAGDFLSHDSHVNRDVHAEFDHDIKIEADKQSQEIILDILKAQTHIPILSEESPTDHADMNALQWVVDPIDGTFNFYRGIPVSCVSIGLWQGMQPLLGVIYDFNRQEMFTSIVGQGAWCNGTAINVSNTPSKSKGVLYSGFPSGVDFSDKNILAITRQVQSYCKVRWIGSAALSLAYVACGRADAYYEEDIMLWDIAAGLSMVKAAGGDFKMTQSKKPLAFNVFACNKHLMDGHR